MNNNLVKLRKERRLTQDGLAMAMCQSGLKITKQTIANLEKKRSAGNLKTYVKIAQFFNKPVNYFYDEK